jgi:secreted PhoX family phosphatase
MKLLYLIIPFLLIYSCNSNNISNKTFTEKDSSLINKEIIDTTPIFKEVELNFNSKNIILPEGFTYKVLFSEGDNVLREDGEKFPAKGNHDLSVFVPDENHPDSKGILYISHETKYKNENLGDGGGATIFNIEKLNGNWQVEGDYNHVDFSNVGYTNRNCGGSLTPNGTIFTCEEAWAHSTDYLYQNGKGMTDTTWVNGRPYWQNMGYIVEVDPISRKVLKKHYQMGKFVHEDALCTKDGKAVYLSDDMNPAVFFKFVPNVAYDYNEGNLFAFKQSLDGKSGEWLKLPNDTSTWINSRNVALEMGATMFVRHEWIEEVNGKIYISETGDDTYNLTQSTAKGGNESNYAANNLIADGDNNFNDPYGRILVFDPSTNEMKVHLECGMLDSLNCFSSPDCNTSVSIGGKTYLVISEDIIGVDHGRSGNGLNGFYNEVYFLDISNENPTLKDVKRFCVAPYGAETTGVIFLPDNSMIINIQHPDRNNPQPFNKSCTILIEGFNK